MSVHLQVYWANQAEKLDYPTENSGSARGVLCSSLPAGTLKQ